jgi:DNA-binding MarR family transcriptional regulator
VLHRLPHDIAAPIINAYADSLTRVFLFAAPFAVVGFVLALFLKQVPLRDTAATGSTDMGEGFAMPTTEPPEKVLEVAIGRLLQRSHGVDLEALAHSPRSRLDTAQLWALMQIYRYAAATGAANLLDIADERRVPRQILEPAFDRLVATGFATREGHEFSLTPAGAAEISSARNVISSWLTESLAQSPDFHGRPDRLQVQGALDRVARGVLMDRDHAHDETRPMKLGPSRRPVAVPPTTRLRTPSAEPRAEPPTRPFRPRAAPPSRPGPRSPRR